MAWVQTLISQRQSWASLACLCRSTVTGRQYETRVIAALTASSSQALIPLVQCKSRNNFGITEIKLSWQAFSIISPDHDVWGNLPTVPIEFLVMALLLGNVWNTGNNKLETMHPTFHPWLFWLQWIILYYLRSSFLYFPFFLLFFFFSKIISAILADPWLHYSLQQKSLIICKLNVTVSKFYFFSCKNTVKNPTVFDSFPLTWVEV